MSFEIILLCLRNPKYFGYIYSEMENITFDDQFGSKYTPSAIQAKEFLTLFRSHVENETTKGIYTTDTGLLKKRLDAIDLIIARHDENKKSFLMNIDINRLVFQLALRVRRPHSIDQGGFGFCGPTTILTALAKRDPVKYTNFVLGLASKGTAKWGSYDVSLKPDDAVGWNTSENKAPEADYVPLLALRKKAELVLSGSASGGIDFDLAKQPSHATTPRQMVQLLKMAGYSKVRDYTVALRTLPKHRTDIQVDVMTRHLKNCSTKITGSNKEIVIMLINADIADIVQTPSTPWGSDPTVPKLADLHWILVKALNVNTGLKSVTIKIVTWCWSKTATLDLTKFVHRYFGYIIATP